jgi:hypothetical protein
MIVAENFDGSGSGGLNGTAADTFSPDITAAGGSAIWAAGNGILDNGVFNASDQKAAYLNMGSYINDTKGTADGLFELTLTISPTTSAWISLGFGQENTPSIDKNFTNTGSGANTYGLGTIIYRAQTSSPAGELDMFGGPGNQNVVDGPDGNTGSRTLTVSLDLTPSGGYNGSSNYGKVTWSDSVLGVLGSYTYTTARTFNSILITEANGSKGTISNLTLYNHTSMITTVQTYGSTSVSESSGFQQDSFQIGLNVEPNSPVQVSVELNFDSPNTANQNDIRLVGADAGEKVFLDFTTSNWQDMQTVTVEAIQDQISEGTETAAVVFQVESLDPSYDGVISPGIRVTILDDDEPGVLNNQTQNKTEVWEKDQTSDTYQVCLQFPPSAPVTLRIEDVSEPNQVTVSPAIVQFDPSNWDQAVTVTVSATADGVVEKDIHTTRLRHSVTSQDMGYQNLLPPELTVLVRDSDCNPDTALAMDLNKDCRVDIQDFAFLAFSWMGCTLPGGQDCIMTDQQHKTFFVSTEGNDSNPGTIKQPFATLEKARDAINDIKNNGRLAGPVTVYLRGGTYRLQQTFLLEPQDSGDGESPILYMSFPGEHAVLSGGVPITGTWQENTETGIWSVDVPGVTGGWNFRQLFANGQRAIRARYPNASESNPFLYATGGNMDYALINPALVKASWGTAADAQINIVPQSRFFNQWNTVTAVNTSTGRIDIADSERHRTIDSGSWFWIEGVMEELDEPGEWFLDQTAGRLYYMPQPGVNPNTLSFVAPLLNRIIYARGDVNAGTHVEYVNFKDLEFQHTTFTLGQIEARVHTDGAVMFENTCDSSVKNCRFENIGGYALWLHLDSNRNSFDRNTVLNSGGGGVLLTGSRFSYMDDTKVYTPGEAAAKVAPILNRITCNTVEHCGKIRYYGGGVHMDSRPFSMSMAPGNYIAHNHFNDLSRNGIFAFRNQGGNVVEYNHIHNALQMTVDAGGIHFATMNHLNSPNFILNNWLYDIWGYEQKPDGIPVRRQANGVYLDWDTSNTTVKDNWIYNYKGNAVAKVFGGNWNVVIADNQSSDTPITPPFVAEVGPDGSATHGIDMDNNKFIGSVIHYTDTSHFDTTGTWTPESKVGFAGLFVFNYLVGTAAVESQARYTLPITEDGTYQISLLYSPASSNASNAPIAIEHADGIANISWNMQQGSSFGFAVAVGTYRFETGKTATVTLSTTGANGDVIADSVGFVKISDTP